MAHVVVAKRGTQPPGPFGAVRQEEACDQRSEPQDVTSSGARHEGGSIGSKRSCLTRPTDLSRLPTDQYPTDLEPCNVTIQPTAAAVSVFMDHRPGGWVESASGRCRLTGLSEPSHPDRRHPLGRSHLVLLLLQLVHRLFDRLPNGLALVEAHALQDLANRLVVVLVVDAQE
jgi:hypothetical protein